MGLLGGFLGAAVGVPGPAYLVFVRLTNLPKENVRATLGVMGVINGVRIAFEGVFGLLTWAAWPLYLSAVVAGMGGASIGGMLS